MKTMDVSCSIWWDLFRGDVTIISSVWRTLTLSLSFQMDFRRKKATQQSSNFPNNKNSWNELFGKVFNEKENLKWMWKQLL